MKMWLVVILAGIVTQLFRISGEYIPIPRNKFMDRFLEAIPISVLVILFFPDIFVSIGMKMHEIAIAIFASILIVIMTIKNVDLGKIMMITVFTVVILNLILTKIFA
ncbi:AzlD domain-containing protein [Streptobacillus felis]|uniref:AzlD domain-containing protein n=1 Tax=Streptobacillus felis TaxID=1384509 RepID=A0A7Z0PGM0_9FUSO|nr:AzlD domain-containing protein [Streptobacillus felis]NYV27685.1 AzlD domain-containing protein [Streptobacillus felis]